MTFLSAIFLAALPLAAAPILLHLFDRRRSVVIEWGAMQFLQEAVATRSHARRLQEWLLLALRVLAIACLAIALSQPMTAFIGSSAGERTETIVILDSSLSTQRGVEQTALFEGLRTTARQAVEKLSGNDLVRGLTAAPYPLWMLPTPVRSDPDGRARMLNELNRLRPTQAGSDLLAALLVAVQAEVDPGVTSRRILLCTDQQVTDWKLQDETGWERLRAALSAAPLPIRIDLAESHRLDKRLPNLAVNQLRVLHPLVGTGQPITITAEIQNHGDTISAPATLNWKSGVPPQTIPALEPGAVHEAIWQTSFPAAGVYAVTAELTIEDPLAADNRATLIIEAAERLPVFVVENAPEQVELQQDAFCVLSALQGNTDDVEASGGLYEPVLISPAALGTQDLSRARAIIVPNYADLPDATLDRLREYVHRGGGLWIALGARTDVERFNHRLYDAGGGLAPLPIDRLVDEPASGPQRTLLDPSGQWHPALATLSDEQRLDTGTVGVTRRFRFQPAPDVPMLLRLTNAEPLAVERTHGHGRVIVLGVPLRLQWSELVRSQAFVVMVHDWLAYLTQPQAIRYNLMPGEPIVLNRSRNSASTAVLQTPAGDVLELMAETTDQGRRFQSGRTLFPGDYLVEESGNPESVPFHVSRPIEESDLEELDETARQRIQAALTQAPRAAGAQSRTAREQPLWHWIWMLFLLTVAGELWLAGRISRQRFGAADSFEVASSSVSLAPLSASRGSRPRRVSA